MSNETPLTESILSRSSLAGLDKDQSKIHISESGLTPIQNQQTPAVLSSIEISEAVLGHLWDLLIFAEHNTYLRLAGLAANQLAKEDERVMLNACFINRGYDGWVVALNPSIEEEEGSSTNSREGCLTWPGKKILADRKEIVTVSYVTVSGEEKRERIEGFEAIVWQHEINHLRGIPEHVIDPEKKAKPNEPCVCGSGKKFKKCCGR